MPPRPRSRDRTRAFAESLGKEVVLSEDEPGFVVNRILLPMINEAVFVLGSGTAGIADIDKGCRLGLAHPMGPLELADFIGLDTCLEIMRVIFAATGDSKYRPAPLLGKYVEAGWLGRKKRAGGSTIIRARSRSHALSRDWHANRSCRWSGKGDFA